VRSAPMANALVAAVGHEVKVWDAARTDLSISAHDIDVATTNGS